MLVSIGSIPKPRAIQQQAVSLCCRVPFFCLTRFCTGNLQSVIGLARNRGIDIVANETSNRATPSLVSFGPKARATGEGAKTQETSNWKNTVGSLKRLIGRSYHDEDIQNVESKFVSSELVDVNGGVGVSVSLSFSSSYLKFTADFYIPNQIGQLPWRKADFLCNPALCHVSEQASRHHLP